MSMSRLRCRKQKRTFHRKRNRSITISNTITTTASSMAVGHEMRGVLLCDGSQPAVRSVESEETATNKGRGKGAEKRRCRSQTLTRACGTAKPPGLSGTVKDSSQVQSTHSYSGIASHRGSVGSDSQTVRQAEALIRGMALIRCQGLAGGVLPCKVGYG